MSAGRCQFREPPEVVRGPDNSHGIYWRVGAVTVLHHRLGHLICLTCHSHTDAARGGIGCGATRAVEAVAARENPSTRGERGSIAA